MANIDTVRSYVDYEIQGLMKPVVKNLDEALRIYAKGQVSPVKRRALMATIDAQVHAVFGASAAAQFDANGKPRTSTAKLLIKQIKSAARAGGETEEHATKAAAAVVTRRDPKGRTLADSIHNSGEELRQHVRELIDHHLKEDTPIEQVVAQLNDYLAAPRNKKRDLTVVGQDGRYAIRRLANNEVNVAHGEAVRDRADGLRQSVRWRLAPKGHPRADVCDRYAEDDGFGLGKGVYIPTEVPRYPAHVGCKCTLEVVTIWRPAPPPPPPPPPQPRPKPPTPPVPPQPPEPDKKKRNTDTPAYRRRAEEAARKRAEREAAKQGQDNKKSSNEAERLRKQAEENARKHQEEVEREKERQRIERRKLLDELERKEREKVIKREAARKKREEEAARKAQEEHDRLQREADERRQQEQERIRLEAERNAANRNKLQKEAQAAKKTAKQAVEKAARKSIPPPTKPKTAKEAEDYARNVLGIKNARYDDAAIGHLLNQGFHEMKVAGYTLLDNVTISRNAFKPGSNAIAHYDPRIDAIVANPLAPYWRNAAKVARDAKRQNWWTNDHPMQVIFHEMGHKQHWDRMTATYGTGSMRSMKWNAWGNASAFPSTFKGSVASKGLSKYGHTNPLELVAEVYSGWIAGRRDYPPELIAVYNSFLGPKLLP